MPKQSQPKDEKLIKAPPEEKLLTEHAVDESGTDHKDVAAVLYKQNVELSVRNKTLSLLRKLYQISILTLDPGAIAEKITAAIREDLNFEMVGIMTVDVGKTELTPLKFAKSEKIASFLSEAPFDSVKIPNPLNNEIFKLAVGGKMMATSEGICKIWKDVFPVSLLEKIEQSAKIRNSLVYPLIIEDGAIGVLIICLNRDYEALSKFEKESIESFINVIAVALDRANLYQQVKAANEKLKELDKLKSEFLSFASHQVRTPMSVVKGYASLIYDGIYGPVPDGVKDTALKIKSSADKMISLVSDFLDLRKIEEGKMEYHLEEIDINKFVGDIVDELKTLADAKHLELTLTTTVPGAKVKADTQKFRQVIQNYTENAIKYTPSGWVKVSIDSDPADHKHVIISVKDSGLGMSQELIPMLFQQFSRDKQNAVKILGTGLGLFIAKTIVEGHGGTTWAESDGEGKGSRFYVKIASV